MSSEHLCIECNHVIRYDQQTNEAYLVCPIQGNCVLPLNIRTDCEYFNYDFKFHPIKICGNCQSYLGWGDWGLACRKHYHKLPTFLSDACEDFNMTAS